MDTCKCQKNFKTYDKYISDDTHGGYFKVSGQTYIDTAYHPARPIYFDILIETPASGQVYIYIKDLKDTLVIHIIKMLRLI